MQKQNLRAQLTKIRQSITDKKQKDKLLCERLSKLLHAKYPQAKNVFTYVSIGSEADTRGFIAQMADTYTLYYPLTGKSGDMLPARAVRFKYLNPNRCGNLPSDCVSHAHEPIIPEITVIPLLGFNEQLYRIGYGRGCYDRYLKGKKTVKIGLAYDEQLCDFIPDPHDIALDYLLTPTRTLAKRQVTTKE
ncbi:MAG: 5-formyltetrahydrofolate cyclo-ligase [Firmicutes bacterium]|nr:5-formyltetrahydrofolate cyclo-ligase [Bacillota bacterium]